MNEKLPLHAELDRPKGILLALRRVVKISNNGKKLYINKDRLFGCVWGRIAWAFLTGDIIKPAVKLPEQKSESLDAMIKKQLKFALQQTSGNRRRTAEMLGISTRTLYRYLVKYKLHSIKKGKFEWHAKWKQNQSVKSRSTRRTYPTTR